MKSDRYLITVRAPGEALTRRYGGRRTFTHAGVLRERRKLKAKGYEVFARKLPGPIARRAPLAARRKLTTASRPVRPAPVPKPRKPGRWDAWRAKNRRVASFTVFCEYDGRHVAKEADHAFGRIGEPWASSHLCLVRMCRFHHRLAHRDRVARENVRRIALRRIALYLRDVDAPPGLAAEMVALFDVKLLHEPLRAVYEWLLDCARRYQIQPPGWKEQA